MTENKKLFLLTGAGFSSGFLKYKGEHLTTKLLTNILLDESKMSAYYQDIEAVQLLPNYWNKEYTKYLFEIPEYCNQIKNLLEEKFDNPNPNYEHLIYALEKITEYNQRSIEYLQKHYNGFVGEEWQIENIIFSLDVNINITRKHIYAAKDFILSVICLFMNEVGSGHDGLKLISTFVSHLYGKKDAPPEFKKISHYTLNYDNLFQLANPDWQKMIYKISYLGIHQEDWPVYYLHGSILFTTNQLFNLWAEVTYNDALRKTEYSEIYSPRSEDYYAHRMITGLGKERKILDFPYDHLYNKMIIDFHSSEEVWIIGYSFSDPHINSILRQGLPRIKKIVIVDKAENANTYIPQLMRKLLFHENLTFSRNDVESSDYIEGTYGLHSKINQKALESQLKLSDKVSNDGFEVEWHLEGTEKFMIDYLQS